MTVKKCMFHGHLLVYAGTIGLSKNVQAFLIDNHRTWAGTKSRIATTKSWIIPESESKLWFYSNVDPLYILQTADNTIIEF